MDVREKPARSKIILDKLLGFISPALNKLFGWKKGEEEERWARKAVDILAKKLRKRNGALEDLEHALRFPNEPSKCVTLPRTADGRLTILYRRCLPHVMFCRIWRWPDLETPRELKSLDVCDYPYSDLQTNICINPYHYNRVGSTDLPPVIVPQYTQPTPEHSYVPIQTSTDFGMPNNVSYPPDKVYTNMNNNNTNVDPTKSSMTNVGSVQNPENMETSDPELDYGEGTLPTVPSTCSASRSDWQVQPLSSNPITNHPDNSAEMTPIHFQEPVYWASIAYYEMNFRVGDMFNCRSNTVTVDGFTNPSDKSNRFCLGQLSNIKRDNAMENVRRHIGKGVKLSYIGGGVYIECLSESAVFVQSRLYNQQHEFHARTVCKIFPGYSLKIFSNQEFAELLSKYIYHGVEAIYELTKMCTIRMSFVKGWGAVYHKQDVTSTPCWIEIHLNGPLQWLDNVLMQMGPPHNAVSSMS